MVFNKKTTEYALYPDGAYPIDARSHFESFKEANETIIEGCISATQNYNEPGQEDRRYYIGQIITTSGPDA